jgi:hypothetical protein
VLAAAIPLLFLHEQFQPGFTVRSAHATLADFAVLAVAVAALATGVSSGFGALRPGVPLWVAGAALVGLVFVSTLYGHFRDASYPTGTHMISTAKFAEYALLAPAVPLLVRARPARELLFGTLTAWSCVVTFIACLQFVGVVDDPFRHARLPGVRAQSILGTHDLASLSCAVLALGLVGIALPDLVRRSFAIAGGVSGAIGLTLSAALAGVAGAVLAAVVVAAISRRRGLLTSRRALGLAGVIAAILAGSLLLRNNELSKVLKLVGIEPGASRTTLAGSSYTQRAVLAYVGGRIFLDAPGFGVGWQASNDPFVYMRYVPDARRRFPDAPIEDFPSPKLDWGVQEAVLEAGADMGVVGIVVFLGLFVTAGVVAVRDRAVVALLWVVTAFAIWNGLSLVAGIPLAAYTWLGVGFAGVPGD